MDDARLQTLADACFLESHRELARWDRAGQIVEQDGALYCLSHDPFPGINLAVRTEPRPASDAEAFVQRAMAFFARHDRAAFSIRARGELDADLTAYCQEQKLYAAATSPGMVLDARLPNVEPPCELRVAQDEHGVRDFVEVCVASYGPLGMPESSARAALCRADRLLAPQLHIVVAYEHDAPVSAALALLGQGFGGVYWVGTVPAARKRGLAPHCTRAATNWAFDQGARRVFLQASKQGAPIYRELGFREHTRYPWFVAASVRAG